MKLSTLTAGIIFSGLSLNAFANDIVFKAADDNLATQACIVAAQDGVSAVKTLARSSRVNFTSFKNTVTCNGETLEDFAATYASQDITNPADANAETQIVKLIVSTDNVESKLCLDAVHMGEKAARAKYSIKGEVICNDVKLSRFVRTFKNKDVQVLTAED